ncbi:MAG: threonine--tRNA ligase [Desulfurococcales archaeon]|nr:threonine--tRNA ligase [Desulfurococcales archaeon]
MGGDPASPAEFVALDQGINARAALLIQAAARKVLPRLEPVGCSVDDRGFKCDFSLKEGEWPTEAEGEALGREAVSMELSGASIRYSGESEDEVLQLLEHTATYEVNGVKAFLEPGAKVEDGRKVKAVKILNISAHNPTAEMRFVRIIGVAFDSDEGLRKYLTWLSEAEKRDHRVLGQKLDLFSFHEEVGPGLVIYHPKGQVIREELIALIREVNKRLGYEEVYTPHVFRSTLWKISGHYRLYRDKMVLAKIEGEEYGIKPMNCPGHILIYKSKSRSYRDLPIKLSEFGTVYRWEKRGELYGLLRVRGFTQDDGHAFLREDQVKDEIKAILKEIMYVLSLFGFKDEEIRVYLSTRPEEYIGTEEMWDKATEALRSAIEELGMRYEVKEGEGAFYGPKIDVHFRDSLGRWWQCSTIQVDFALPERFGLEYVESDGSKKRPVMIHRAILGSVERFMAIIIEEFAGKLPTWLSPTQAVVIPVKTAAREYAEEVARKLSEEGFRAVADLGDETPSKKIRRAYDEGVPYILLVGPREAAEGSVTVRGRGNVQVKNVPLGKFIEALRDEVSSRSLKQAAIEALKPS